jgi:two-component system, chemotaxis family, sensor kinase Cph1
MSRGFLALCEEEKLHFSGAIQDHGTLLAVGNGGKITHAAANIADFLGEPVEFWLDRPLPQSLADHVADMPTASGSRRFLRSGFAGVNGMLDLAINRGEAGVLLLEFTPEDKKTQPSFWAKPANSQTYADEGAVVSARQNLIEEMRLLTGAARVLYYAFGDQGDGVVIGEVRKDDTFGSYLGLRFPASDIPQIARALYLKNPWRLISDARREPTPLLGCSPAPPDLSWSDLRSASPVHRVYLGNMGVVGALSFPVIIAGDLAALISVHDDKPLMLSHSLIESLAKRVRSFNFSVLAFRTQHRMRMIDNLARHFDDLRIILWRHGDLLSAWPEIAPLVCKEFAVDGAMLCLDESCASVGVVFEPAALAVFDDWFCAEQGDLIWLGDSLVRQIPGFPLSETAGALALRIQLSNGADLRLYLTRCEHIHEVAWGGNPDKPVEFHDGALGIAPRRSFEKWIERRLGHSRPWGDETRLLGLKLRELLQSEMRR